MSSFPPAADSHQITITKTVHSNDSYQKSNPYLGKLEWLFDRLTRKYASCRLMGNVSRLLQYKILNFAQR